MQAACIELLPRAPQGSVGSAELGQTPSLGCKGERCERAYGIKGNKINQHQQKPPTKDDSCAGSERSAPLCMYVEKRAEMQSNTPKYPCRKTSLKDAHSYTSSILSLPPERLVSKPVLQLKAKSSGANRLFTTALHNYSTNLHQCKTASSDKG